MTSFKRTVRWIFWPSFAFAILALGLFFWSENPLLGRWTRPHYPDFEGGGPSGYEFFRTRRFVTFGLEREGNPIKASGIYRFTTNNEVELEFKEFRVRIGGIETNIAIKPLPPLFDPITKFTLSSDGQMLEKIDTSGWEGGSLVLYKEKSNH